MHCMLKIILTNFLFTVILLSAKVNGTTRYVTTAGSARQLVANFENTFNVLHRENANKIENPSLIPPKTHANLFIKLISLKLDKRYL